MGGGLAGPNAHCPGQHWATPCRGVAVWVSACLSANLFVNKLCNCLKVVCWLSARCLRAVCYLNWPSALLSAAVSMLSASCPVTKLVARSALSANPLVLVRGEPAGPQLSCWFVEVSWKVRHRSERKYYSPKENVAFCHFNWAKSIAIVTLLTHEGNN